MKARLERALDRGARPRRRCRACSELLAVERRRAGPRSARRAASQASPRPTSIPAVRRLDLELAVADEAQRHRLHAAGRAGAGQLAPQHRRQREADQIVERAARQIGVDQRASISRGCFIASSTACLVMALKTTRSTGLSFSTLAAQHLQHVPGDRLALAVRVGGEDQLVGVLHRLGDVGERLAACGSTSQTSRNRRRGDRAVLGGRSRTWPRRPGPVAGPDTC
jgi:hypothetical protein